MACVKFPRFASAQSCTLLLCIHALLPTKNKHVKKMQKASQYKTILASIVENSKH